ncbi:unnamed protein product [Sphagnum jensenii]|uniref:Uncharacterized protein n=1 Tax=Sphagnum jensenii TaxID=128206 RepID=A0ABP0WV54_9BRYO
MEFHLSLRSEHGQMVALFLSHHRPEWLQFGLELCMLEPKVCLTFCAHDPSASTCDRYIRVNIGSFYSFYAQPN